MTMDMATETHEQLLTLDDFASRIGKSRRQAARYVQRAAVTSTVMVINGHRQTMVPKTEVERFRSAIGQADYGFTQGDDVHDRGQDVVHGHDVHSHVRGHFDHGHDVHGHDVHGQNDAGHVHGHDHGRDGRTSIPIEAFQVVVERMESAVREAEGLRFSLQQHRLALEENARSIVEREARAREAEAKAADAAGAEERARAAELQAAQETQTRQTIESHLEQVQQETIEETLRRQTAEAALADARKRLAEFEAASARKPWWKRILRSRPAES